MTTQPPSHEEVQRSIAWHKALLAGRPVADQTRVDAFRDALEESDEMLESLLADNVRLSGDKLHFAEYIVGLEEELTAKDERIAALEKDAAPPEYFTDIANRVWRFLAHDSSQATYAEITTALLRAASLAQKVAALNPAGQCSGTATGRD